MPKAQKESKKQVQVTFSSTDLQNFNTSKTTLIKNQTAGTTEEDKILKSLFVTSVGDAEAEFEKEKEQEVEDQLG